MDHFLLMSMPAYILLFSKMVASGVWLHACSVSQEVQRTYTRILYGFLVSIMLSGKFKIWHVVKESKVEANPQITDIRASMCFVLIFLSSVCLRLLEPSPEITKDMQWRFKRGCYDAGYWIVFLDVWWFKNVNKNNRGRKSKQKNKKTFPRMCPWGKDTTGNISGTICDMLFLWRQ